MSLVMVPSPSVFFGHLMQVKTFCTEGLFTPCTLDNDVKELVDLHDQATRTLNDVAHHVETGEKYYPIRVQILKTLLLKVTQPLYDSKILEMHIRHSNRDAILILRAALRRRFDHNIVEKTFEEERHCTCRNVTAVITGMFCETCRCVVCKHCSRTPCVGRMNKLVNYYITGESDIDYSDDDSDDDSDSDMDSEDHSETSNSAASPEKEEEDEKEEEEVSDEEGWEDFDEEEEMEEEEESEIDSDAEIDVVNVSFVAEEDDDIE